MGDGMSQLHYAVVTLQETYGGPEEGGWWKEVGLVEMLVTVDTDLDFGMKEKYMGEEHINESNFFPPSSFFWSTIGFLQCYYCIM
jgi:hypothetical protein